MLYTFIQGLCLKIRADIPHNNILDTTTAPQDVLGFAFFWFLTSLRDTKREANGDIYRLCPPKPSLYSFYAVGLEIYIHLQTSPRSVRVNPNSKPFFIVPIYTLTHKTAMHGLIHVVLKELVLENWGEEKWGDILKELGVTDDSGILKMSQYPDDLTVTAIVTTAKVLGVSVETAFHVYGGFFVRFVHGGDHLRMLQSMGDDIEMFLNNINHLHHVLERSYRESSFPYFKIEKIEESKYTLSYRSARGGLLAPLVEGIIPELSKLLYKQKVELTKVEDLSADGTGFNAIWTMTTAPLEESISLPPLSPRAQKEADEKGGLWHSAVMIGGGSHRATIRAAPGVVVGFQKEIVLPEHIKVVFDELEVRHSESRNDKQRRIFDEPSPLQLASLVAGLGGSSSGRPSGG